MVPSKCRRAVEFYVPRKTFGLAYQFLVISVTSSRLARSPNLMSGCVLLLVEGPYHLRLGAISTKTMQFDEASALMRKIVRNVIERSCALP